MHCRAEIGYLVGYRASNIWKVWFPRTNSYKYVRDATFNKSLNYRKHPSEPLKIRTAYNMVGIYFAVIGNNCAIPTVLAFLSNNVVGSSKRQIAVPLQTSLAAIGGIFGSLVFWEQDYPGYRPGLYASIACLVVCILITLFITAFFRRENQAADKKGKILEGLEGYRYTL
ncbi:Major facilitator superfamily domain general substrate transporter [Penicillium vulpinum]|nr:Major facilitator superfamily domain general substrate transporter [Penicillium vulpinum]KAJ5961366.1 Major facilitator superfamily domain general substrate transporter [Penicillium vulpinum]